MRQCLSLTVNEFRGSSNSNTLWTTKRAMQSWNTTRFLYGNPIPVGFAFKRPWEGGHGNQSQHYAGVAFDVGQRLSNEEINRLRNLARESGVWSYVKPASLIQNWVHFDKRFGRFLLPIFSLRKGNKKFDILCNKNVIKM